MCVCVCACMCICIYTHMYAHIYYLVREQCSGEGYGDQKSRYGKAVRDDCTASTISEVRWYSTLGTGVWRVRSSVPCCYSGRFCCYSGNCTPRTHPSYPPTVPCAPHPPYRTHRTPRTAPHRTARTAPTVPPVLYPPYPPYHNP